MPRFDLPPAELRTYRPEVAEPADFDEFWAMTLTDHRPDPAPVITPFATPLRLVDAFDVTFAGFDGHPIKAWLLLPKNVSEPLPGVVEYLGYGGGRSVPDERLAWVSAGYAYLVMDTRSQGGEWWSGGATTDPVGSGPAVAGWMTRGIESPETYFYRRVFTDAVQAVEVLRRQPQVNPEQVAVTGCSQGGGIAIAAAGLVSGLVGAIPDMPFLCHFERAVGLTDREPFNEVVRYLSAHRGAEAQVFKTLSYFDGVNFAKRATAPAYFSVGLLDPVCPPSTIFAARNHWGGPSEIVEYPFNEHDGGEWWRRADWLASRLSADSPTWSADSSSLSANSLS
ncbi:MAG: acetylxylan esterase [Propionibacteriaceae bacterium]|jgi:cephalosporin-C deacetylase|nr:acetylxylan esterase [Propionibacteriaceae bacterium]